jgi:phosphatidylglycerophosphate synthase
MRPELRLHVARDALYVVIFATLPFVAWRGLWTAVFAAILFAEIVITMLDFITEDKVRRDVGGVFPGERITHAVMGIIYGAMLGYLVPVLWAWFQQPSGLVVDTAPVPVWLRAALGAAAVGILVHGLRDLAAVLALPGSDWPWARAVARERIAGP